MTMKRYSVFLPDQLKEAIEAKAAKIGTPTAEHIRAAIAAYCEAKPLDNPPPRGQMKSYGTD